MQQHRLCCASELHNIHFCKAQFCQMLHLATWQSMLAGEEQVTMLSYQHNSIRSISRIEQLPQLTILDMYSNNIQSLQGLHKAASLRGLMLGRNYLSAVDSQEVSPCPQLTCCLS